MKQQVKERKAGVIGCGFVGAASGFALMQSGLFSELVLLDADRAKAEAEAFDISHGVPFSKPMQVYAGDYDDLADAAILIIAAGVGQKPGESRLSLLSRNVEVFRSIIPALMERNFGGILLIVSNPVDILSYLTLKLSGYPKNRVIGSGTVLDTARLRTGLAQYLRIDNRSVHAYIVGEHGDSEIPAWSCANVSGIPLGDFCAMRGFSYHAEDTERIAEEVKKSAYEIIARKGATYYGIAMAVRRICEAVVRDEKSILPVSVLFEGEYGIRDTVLSMPCIVGRAGIESKVPIALSRSETAALQASAQKLQGVLAELKSK